MLNLFATQVYRERLKATYILGIAEVNRLAEMSVIEQENYLTSMEAMAGLRTPPRPDSSGTRTPAG